MSKISQEYYKLLISQNKSEQLCDEMLGHLNTYVSKDENSVLRKSYDHLIMITGRLKSINQEQSLNIINFEDANIEKSKIDHSLLTFINQLPNYYFDFINGGEIKLTTSKDIRKNIDDLHEKSQFEYDAFFSYSSEDYKDAKKICEELRGYGLKIFLSGEALKSTIGSSFFEKIENALKNSQHFILLSSVNSMDSEWVKTEYETFYNEFFIPSKGDRRLLITKGEGYNQSDVPTLLRRLQIADSPKEIIDTFLKENASSSNKDIHEVSNETKEVKLKQDTENIDLIENIAKKEIEEKITPSKNQDEKYKNYEVPLYLGILYKYKHLIIGVTLVSLAGFFLNKFSNENKKEVERTSKNDTKKDIVNSTNKTNSDDGMNADMNSIEDYSWKEMKDGKIWMTQNLNVITNEAWCYKDVKSNCDENGRLYTLTDAFKACPKGSYLPRAVDWKNLFKFYGNEAKKVYQALMKGGESGLNIGETWYISHPVENRKMLETSTIYWSGEYEADGSGKTYVFDHHRKLSVSGGISDGGRSGVVGAYCRCIKDQK